MNPRKTAEEFAARQMGKMPVKPDKIRSLLACKGAAWLYEEVRDRYADELRIYWSSDSDRIKCGKSGSCLTFDGDTLSAANIALVESHRTAEALAHELLHLKLYRDGFSYIETKDYKGRYRALLARLRNNIEHESMILTFISMGFDRAKFVIPKGDEPSRTMNLLNDPKVVVSRKVKFTEISMPFNDTSVKSLSKYREKITIKDATDGPATTAEELKIIESWIIRGAYRNVGLEFEAFNELLAIVGMPPSPAHRWNGEAWTIVAPAIPLK